MDYMFIDESGDHNLDVKKVDKAYPLFVLAGCIFNDVYYKNVFIKNFNKFKTDMFGNDDICLHTLELNRPQRSKDKRFQKLNNSVFRINFYTKLNKLIEMSEFTLVACVIRKLDHQSKYGLSALDPYLLSFDNLLNRFIFDLKHGKQGKILAERRDDILDNKLELAWLNVKISGTTKVKPSEIKERIYSLQLLSKKSNEPGLQLADLVVSPIGRKILNKTPRLGHEVDFQILKTKFRRLSNIILNAGLTILPK